MEVQKKRCYNCKTIVDQNINFCPDCGNNQFEWVDKDITMQLRTEHSPWYNQEVSNTTREQNKIEEKRSNKLKIIVITMILIIIVGSLFAILMSFFSNNDADISNQGPKVEYTKGELVNNVYYNEWADIKVSIPEGYSNATEDEYSNSTDEVSDCLLIFYEPSGDNMIISAQDISSYPNISVDAYLDGIMQNMENDVSIVFGLENVDITYWVNKERIQLHGYTYVQLSYQIAIKGEGQSRIQNIYARKIDNRILMFITSVDTEEKNKYLLSCLSNYEEHERTSEIEQTYEVMSELSTNIDSFQVQIMDEVYQFPVNYDDFVATGWKVNEKYNSIDEQIKCGTHAIVSFHKNGVLASFYVFNPDISLQTVEGCVISGLCSINPIDNKGRKMDIYIPGGFKVGEATKTQILESYREPDNIYESDTSSTLTFETDNIYANIKLKFDENDILNDVTLENPVATEDYEYSNVDTTYVAEYTVPTSMGDKTTDRIVNFDGDLYQLPVTVNALMENGWSTDDAHETVVGGSLYHFDLERNGVSFSATAYNYSEYATEVAQCYIQELSSSDVYRKRFEISGGIHMEMTEDELKSILDSEKIEFATETYKDGILYGFHIGEDTWENYVNIKFSNGKVSYITISAGEEWMQ